jgi:Asp-tRNA(Asn)/Glu-tRNA(Gln) amidotransferase B subunit
VSEWLRGAKFPFTADIVRNIRQRMTGAPRGTQRRLAREYGITEQNVSFIVKRKAWAHIL